MVDFESSNHRRISNEQHETREYSNEDVIDLVFWSFQPSQGAPEVHLRAWTAIVAENPSLIPAARTLKATLGDDFTKWKDNPLVIGLAERLKLYRGSKMHSRPMETLVSVEEAIKGLQSLFDAASIVGGWKEHDQKSIDWVLRGFVADSIERDYHVEGRANNMPGITKYRERIGWSLLCWLGLSDARESRLKGLTEGDLSLPPEIQTLWRHAGDYARAHYEDLSQKTKDYLLHYVKRYEATLGESLHFP